MSVNQYDVRIYGAASMSDSTGTTGGAVSFSRKVSFQDVASAVVPHVVSSSGSDTSTTLTIYSLTSGGTPQNEVVTLSGTTATAGTLTAGRLMKGLVGGTGPVGDVAILGNELAAAHTFQANASGNTTAGATLQSGDGSLVALGSIIQITNNTPSGAQAQLRMVIQVSGDNVIVDRAWGTVPTSSTTYNLWNGMLFPLTPNAITEVRRIFYAAAAQPGGGSTNTWYEKIFVVNDNTTLDLTAAAVLKQVDPAGLYSGGGALDFALTTALNDSGSITTNLNPGSPPSGITSYSSGAAPQSINVPSPQVLTHGAAPNAANSQAMWLRLTLVAGEATVNSFTDVRVTGSTV